jgi:hypothetical protein
MRIVQRISIGKTQGISREVWSNRKKLLTDVNGFQSGQEFFWKRRADVRSYVGWFLRKD